MNPNQPNSNPNTNTWSATVNSYSTLREQDLNRLVVKSSEDLLSNLWYSSPTDRFLSGAEKNQIFSKAWISEVLQPHTLWSLLAEAKDKHKNKTSFIPGKNWWWNRNTAIADEKTRVLKPYNSQIKTLRRKLGEMENVNMNDVDRFNELKWKLSHASNELLYMNQTLWKMKNVKSEYERLTLEKQNIEAYHQNGQIDLDIRDKNDVLNSTAGDITKHQNNLITLHQNYVNSLNWLDPNNSDDKQKIDLLKDNYQENESKEQNKLSTAKSKKTQLEKEIRKLNDYKNNPALHLHDIEHQLRDPKFNQIPTIQEINWLNDEILAKYNEAARYAIEMDSIKYQFNSRKWNEEYEVLLWYLNSLEAAVGKTLSKWWSIVWHSHYARFVNWYNRPSVKNVRIKSINWIKTAWRWTADKVKWAANSIKTAYNNRRNNRINNRNNRNNNNPGNNTNNWFTPYTVVP